MLPTTLQLPPVELLERETSSRFPRAKALPVEVAAWARQKMSHNSRGFEPTREHGCESISSTLPDGFFRQRSHRKRRDDDLHAVFLQFEGEGCSLKKELSKSAAFPLERGTREDSYFPETSPYLRTSFFRASICVLLLLCAVP
jgi:hypothetical protein